MRSFVLTLFLRSTCSRWRAAFVCLASTLVGAAPAAGSVCPNDSCELSTRRPVDWCWVSTWPSQTLVAPPAEDLSDASELFCAGINATGPSFNEITRIQRCGPPLNLELNSAGGSWAGVTLSTRTRVTRADNGGVIFDGERPWGFASCGCNDSRSTNFVGIGTDLHCYCKKGLVWNSITRSCYPYRDRHRDKPDVCSSRSPGVGNPIRPLTGTKEQRVVLDDVAGMPLALTYRSAEQLPTDGPNQRFAFQAPPSFGPGWSSSAHRGLANPHPGYSGDTVHHARGDGSWTTFTRVSSALNTHGVDPDVNDRLLRNWDPWAAVMTFRLYDAGANAIDVYAFAGSRLVTEYADGRRIEYFYSTSSTPPSVAPAAGLLIEMRNERGRSLTFAYEASVTAGQVARIVSMTNHDSKTTTFSYDALGNLARITWPDGSYREYRYEQAGLPHALTGAIDERRIQVGAYGYDGDGRATLTQGAGGVQRFTVAAAVGSRWSVTETFDADLQLFWRDHWLVGQQGVVVTGPRQATASMASTDILGVARLTSQSQPAGAGCAPAASSQSYDANANVTIRDDFSGRRSCYAYDMGRNLETVRVEGLLAGDNCGPLLAANAPLPAGTRKISTSWHPDWRLQAATASPRLLTRWVYQGQPDPTANNAAASCGPAGSLVDGKPRAWLCKRIEQATTDADGTSGLSPTLDLTVQQRVWSWTYDATGNVLTATDPLGRQTQYTYRATTTSDYSVGDLATVRNPEGHLTRYHRHDRLGRVLEEEDANGVVTTHTYSARGQRLTTTAAGATSTFSYWPMGALRRATAPDGSYVEYGYDDAQRLAWAVDNLGNRLDYRYDDAGNREEDRVTDPGGALRQHVLRSFDALNRMQRLDGRP
jgi:YD repeat-containing protein